MRKATSRAAKGQEKGRVWGAIRGIVGALAIFGTISVIALTIEGPLPPPSAVPPSPPAIQWRAVPAPVTVIDRLKSFTVMVRAFDDGKPDGSGSGTLFKAFLAGQPVIVAITSAHLITEDSEEPSCTVETHFRLPDGQTIAVSTFKTDILLIDTVRDVAVLLVRAPDVWPAYAKFGQPAPLVEGTPVQHVGFMLGDKFGMCYARGYMMRCGARPVDGWPWDIPLDMADMTIMPGSSGGGIFDESGAFVGVMAGKGKQGGAFFVPLRTVQESIVASKLALVF